MLVNKLGIFSAMILAAVSAQALVVNLDVDTSADHTFSGQGGYSDPGNDFWNSSLDGMTDLTASDGVTSTTIDVTLSAGGRYDDVGGAIPDGESHSYLMGDYSYARDSDTTVEITGLTPDGIYLLYVYCQGNGAGQTATVTFGGSTVSTTGDISGTIVEGANYAVFEVTADGNGELSGTVARNGSDYSIVNGLQLVEAGINISSSVMNVDLGGDTTGTAGDGDNNTGTPFSGQGAYADSGNDYWNNTLANDNMSLTNLTASDGSTATAVDVTVTGGNGFEDTGKSNYLLSDYFYGGSSVLISDLTPEGLYTLYVYACGDTSGQGSDITIDGETQTTSNSGDPDYYSEGINYVVFDTAADESGQITITASDKLNGFQLIDLAWPTAVLSAAADTVTNSYTVAVTFSETVTGLEESDFVVSNGSVVTSSLSGVGMNWSVEISPAGNGDVSVSLPEGAVSDSDGNPNSESDSLVTTYVAPGSEQPVPTLSTSSSVVYGDFTVQVDFSEDVVGLAAGDFEVSGGTASSVSGSGSSWSVVISPNFGGDVTVSLPKNSVTDTDGDGLMNTASDELTAAYYPIVHVSSLDELRTYLDQDNVSLTMEPGTYIFTEDDEAEDVYIGTSLYKMLLHISGDNCTYDFTDVTIQVTTAVFRAHGNYDVYEFHVCGNDNVYKNLTLEDVGSVDDNPTRGALNVCMDGQRNRIEGFHITAKGSTPYAYGDAFGKGSDSILPLDKHSVFLVRGTDNHVKGCTLIHRAFGHALFIQAGWNALIEDCYVEGEVRSTDDMLAEEGTGSAADEVEFMTIWDYTLPAGFMMSLNEAGVRAYSSGTTVIDGESYSRNTIDPTVVNCTLKFTRTGVNLDQAVGTATSIGCTSIGVEGFGGADTARGHTIDVSYGAAFNNTVDNRTTDVTITQLFDSYNGEGRIGYVGGSGNTVTVRCDEPLADETLYLAVGGGMNTIRHQPGSSLDYQNVYEASDNTISNLTDCPVVLSTNSENNTVVSYGPVTDLGTGNSVTILEGFRGDNVALNGAASQSSTDYEGYAELAIDGNTDGKFSNDSVTHTETEAQPWWQVDLQDTFEIETIEIWGRTDSTSQDRLSNYDVFVYDESGGQVWTDYQADYPDPYVSLDVGGIGGRYVKVQLRGDTEPLSLAEVRVCGSRSDPEPYLVGEWTFDSQTLANSGLAGMVHDGTIMNSTGDDLYSTDTRDGSGYSLKLDSDSEFLRINNSASGDSDFAGTFASHAFTLSMWAKTDGAWTKWNEFAGKSSEDDGDGWALRARLFGSDDDDGLRVDSYNDETAVLDEAPYAADLLDQEWHLLTVTYDGSALNLYLDANLAGSADDVVITGAETYPLVFGARDDGSRGEDILIDDLQFYNKALSASEVAALYTGDTAASADAAPTISAADNNVNIQFEGTFGESYRVESIDDLASSNGWQTVTDIVWAASSPIEVSEPMTNSAGFYRLQWIP